MKIIEPEDTSKYYAEGYSAGQKDEQGRITKAILNIPELGAGVTLSHPATSEQVTLRDKIINICKGT